MATRKKVSRSQVKGKALPKFFDVLKASWDQYKANASKYIISLLVVYVVSIVVLLLVLMVRWSGKQDLNLRLRFW